jgi:hypothetical protein
MWTRAPDRQNKQQAWVPKSTTRAPVEVESDQTLDNYAAPLRFPLLSNMFRRTL